MWLLGKPDPNGEERRALLSLFAFVFSDSNDLLFFSLLFVFYSLTCLM